MERIALSEAEKSLESKESIYQALAFNQYVLPPLSDPLISIKFMIGLMHHKYWLPKSAQITQFRVCAITPSKSVLAGYVYDALMQHHSVNRQIDAAMKRTASLIRKKKPDCKWLLVLLAQLNPDHLVFTKQHTHRVAHPSRQRRQESLTFPNTDGFFNDLDLRPSQRKAKRRVNLVDPETQK